MRKLGVFVLLMLIQSMGWTQSHSPSKDSPLFTLLPAKKTNIHFNNRLADTKEHNILIYSNFYGGAGVAIGDLNNDGLQDIYFAGNQVADKLYLNKGNMVFEEVSKQAGIVDNGGWSSGVLFGDVNQDGWMDIYVSRELYDDSPELRKNKLYINKGIPGQLSFTEQSEAYGIDNSERTRNASFLDYDKDGDLDLFLCNQPPNPGDYSPFYNTELIQEQYSIRLFELDGNRYRDVTEEAGLLKTGFPNAVTASDLNNDGWTDLYVSNDFWIGDWLFINKGDGTFTDKIDENVRHISFSSMGVDAADINNDGQLDVMVLDMAAEDNYRSKANMSGMNPKAFWKVVKNGGHYQYMFNSLQFNLGDAQFSEIAQLSGMANTDWSWSNLIADLDNDGLKDVYVTNGLMRDIRNNDASKVFKEYIESSLHSFLKKNPNPQGLSIWDVVDLEKTLALVPSEKLSNYVFKNESEFRFSKRMEAWGLDHKSFSNGAAYADLDNDGDLDIVVNNINDKAFVYENHAADQKIGNFLRIKAMTSNEEVSVLGAKVWVETENGEQYVEITSARGMYSSSEQIAHFGIGSENKVKKIRLLWPDGKENFLTNVNGNQQIELKYSDAKSRSKKKNKKLPPLFSNITDASGVGYKHEENPFDDYSTQVLLPHKMSSMGPSLAKGDVNGDLLEDFYIGGAVGKPGTLFLQQAGGDFIASDNQLFFEEKVHEDVGAIFFDADQDQDMDLYVVSGGNEFRPGSDIYQDRLYINDGSGNFTKGQLPDMGFSGSKVLAEDYDKDGDLDLFVAGRHIPWAYPLAANSVLLENKGGTFENVSTLLAPELTKVGMVNDASWMDYDGDGWMDLVLVGEWMPLTFLKNEEGKSFRKDVDISLSPAIESSSGWWFSIETADIDGDGDEDIVAGNLGLNYKYKASREEPFEVYYYDFDENGKEDIVLTYYNFGIKYPLRGRECSSQQVPNIVEKFTNYDLFASSDVFDIYGDKALENAIHYEAQTFATTYFENKGNGEFESHPLPIETQFSSVNDILLEDFNKDGHLDILMAGNLYASEVETARNDAGYGMLLFGDGEGKFEPITRDQSGFFVPYNVKSMLKLKVKEQERILVGVNDGPLQIFELLNNASK